MNGVVLFGSYMTMEGQSIDKHAHCAELFSVMYPGAYDAAEQASIFGSHFILLSLRLSDTFQMHEA